jgi:outer membrane lipoprotein-sorting protein
MRKILLAVPALLLLLPVRSAFAADDLKSVLHQLDEAASNFHTASADFKFDNIQTEPVPDTDVWSGVVYYEHKGNEFRMAAHIQERDNQPFPAVYNYSDGVFQYYQQNLNQVTRYKNNGNLAGYLMTGFGASGKELADKFNITYDGQETIDGVKTDKLEMVPKDPSVLRLFQKVTIWIDPTRDVNLKQVFDEGEGLSRICTYSGIKLNEAIPGSDFTFKTDKKTKYANQ